MTETPKKILHVVRRLDIAGGAERIVADLVRCSPGHDVLVFDGGDSFFPLGDARVLRARNILHALWLCAINYRRYNWFHLHLFPAIYFASLLGKKAIIHEHNTHNARRDRLVFRPVEYVVYRRAGLVIAISDAVKKGVLSWVGPGITVEVLPNFVATMSGPASPPATNDGRLVVMVASFTDQKRQDMLIRALAHLPEDVRVAFAGNGPRLKACETIAVDMGLAHRITFLGEIKNVADVYSQADLCVLVSHWEGFGLVVLEAAQFGVATVISDVEGLRDICPNPRLRFAGNDPAQLSAKITEGLEFSRLETNRSAVRNFAKEFSIEKYIDKLNVIYES